MRFGRVFLTSITIAFIFLLIGSKTVLAAPGTSALTAYLKLDDSTQGSTATDSSGYNNNMSPFGGGGGPTPISNYVPYTTFPDPRSFSFDGSSQYLSKSSPSSFNQGTNPRSISAWIFSTSHSIVRVPVAYGMCAAGGGGHDGQAFGFYLDSSNSIHFWGCGTADFDTGTTISDNTWVHIAVTYDGSNVKVYKNGSQIGSTVTESLVSPTITPYFQVGGVPNIDGSSNAHFWSGYIDDVRYYNRALSSIEISDLAAGNHTTATWTGAVSTNFETAGNWDINAVPEPYTTFIIPSTTNIASLSANEQFGGVTINSGGILNLAGFNLTMNDYLASKSGLATNSGTLISNNSEILTNFILPTNSGTVMYNNTINATGLSLGNTYNNLIFNDGLVGYWKLDETSQGSTAVDSSGYGNNGTPVGSTDLPTPSSSVPAVNFTDKESLNFDGSDDYVDCGVTPRNLPIGSSARTISAWINGTSFVDSYGKTIAGWGIDSGGQLSELRVTTSFKVEFHGNGNDVAGVTTLSPGQWYHVAATVTSSGAVTIYVNGIQDGTGSVTLNTPESNCKIGRQPNFNGQYFNGLIDDVRIYNRALSAAEIAALAAGNEPGTSIATSVLNHDLTVNGNLVFNGGTLDTGVGNNYGVTVDGNFENDGGIFNARLGTVTLTGIGQTINSSNSFYNLTKSVSSADTLTFAQGSTSTISGTLTLSGAASNLLALRSASSGAQFNIDPQGTRALSYLNPQDSNNINATAIAYGSTFTYGTNLTNWLTTSSTPTPTPTLGPSPTPTPTSSSNSGGSSSSTSSPSSPSCAATAPSGVPNLYQLDPTTNSVTLYFTPVSGATDYYISYGMSSSVNQYATSFSDSDMSGAISYTINSLQSGTTYYFQVRAGNGCATGNWSNTSSAITAGKMLESNPISDVSQTISQVVNPPKKISIVSSGITSAPSNVCVYTIVSGDSLWSIAQSKLGDGTKYTVLQDLNKLSSSIHPGQQLQLPCNKNSQTIAKATQEVKQTGVNLDVKVLAMNNQPVVDAIVTLHSKIQMARTDKNGIAHFANVEAGEHKVLLAYDGYTGEEKLKIDGTKKEQTLTLEVQLQGFSYPLVAGVVGILVGIIAFLSLIIIILLKKRKKNSQDISQK